MDVDEKTHWIWSDLNLRGQIRGQVVLPAYDIRPSCLSDGGGSGRAKPFN